MTKTLSLFFVLLSFSSLGQHSNRIAKLVQTDRTKIIKLTMEESNTVTYLPSEFAQEILVTDKYDHLHEATIIKVYYVYTQYKLNPSFDQLTLDTKRFRLLDEYFPEIITDPFIEWQLLEQTGCQHFSEGEDYFHGFVIIHRPLPTAESHKVEFDRISAFLDNPTETFMDIEVDPIKKQLTGESESGLSVSTSEEDHRAEYSDGEYAMYLYLKRDMKNCEEVAFTRVDEWINVSFTVDEEGAVKDVIFNDEYSDAIQQQVSTALVSMPAWKPAIENGTSKPSTVNLEIRVSYSPTVKGMYKRDGLKPTFEGEEIHAEEITNLVPSNPLEGIEPMTLKGTTVFKGLDLLLEYEELALVMDVTGSMSSNVAAMIFWIKTHNTNQIPFSSYTFFNDGDNAPTKKKKIGQTGGIYFTDVFREMNATLKEAIQQGNGGERPENDIEAILKSIEMNPSSTEILLIGDNYSEVRDLKLLTKVDRPVHVLLCSAPKAVRPDYLQIAHDTGGIFIINGKEIDLSTVQKGEKIIIQETEYKYTGTEFKNLGVEEY